MKREGNLFITIHASRFMQPMGSLYIRKPHTSRTVETAR